MSFAEVQPAPLGVLLLGLDRTPDRACQTSPGGGRGRHLEGPGAPGAGDGNSKGHEAGTGGPVSTVQAAARHCTAPEDGNQKIAGRTAAAGVEGSRRPAGQAAGTHSSY